jgi:pyrroloquinoline quinone (PQQ) biosynthesis protein C
MAGHTCYHCRQRVPAGEAHDCWTTTEGALTRDLPDDLREAWERLREAIAEYIEEEVGHQEWILDDLETLGVSRAAVLEAGPSPATELMVAYAYDTIHRGNPVGFFGMVLVLEGTSVALATRAADVIETTLGLPKKAFRYLRSHGSLDVEHTGFYEGLMDRLHEPSDQAAVVHAARMFYGLYGAVFQGLRNAPALAVAA